MRCERWPVEIKLHGYFYTQRLKNTTDELKQPDDRVRWVFNFLLTEHLQLVIGEAS
jgi:hypothetical protein